MKKIHCLAITEYKQCPITILHFDYSFIYLFVSKGMFYYTPTFYTPKSPLTWIKWRLGLSLLPYTPDEISGIKSAILSDAYDKIDKLLIKK